jgi:ABC-type transporter Mla MlaB component
MVLLVSEELTISTVVEEKVRVMGALDRGEDLEVDGRAVREVDVAGLQVLLAAKREAEARGKAFRLTTAMCSESLTHALALAALGDALIAKEPATETDHG